MECYQKSTELEKCKSNLLGETKKITDLGTLTQHERVSGSISGYSPVTNLLVTDGCVNGFLSSAPKEGHGRSSSKT